MNIKLDIVVQEPYKLYTIFPKNKFLKRAQIYYMQVIEINKNCAIA